ncbi:MAG: hypothetical protein ABIJ92_04440 [Candidatus Aenigmatarchaeota archaeon]
MTRSKPEFTRESIRCPFCKKADIDITKTLDWYSEGRAHAAGRSKLIPKYHPEKLDVHTKCPECKASKTEIKDSIERGTGKMTHEERIKRLRESGLPTRIES